MEPFFPIHCVIINCLLKSNKIVLTLFSSLYLKLITSKINVEHRCKRKQPYN